MKYIVLKDGDTVVNYMETLIDFLPPGSVVLVFEQSNFSEQHLESYTEQGFRVVHANNL